MAEREIPEVGKEIYLIVCEDADPFCGVHPICAFTNRKDAEKCIEHMEKEHGVKGYFIKEIKLYDSFIEEI